MTGKLLYRAIALGLTNGLSCIGLCLPVALPTIAGTKTTTLTGSILRVLIFLLGRLIAYLFFGFLAGLIGVTLQRFPFFHFWIIPILYLLLALLLIIYGITGLNPFPHFTLCRLMQPHLNSSRFLFLLGFLVGLSPCPPFLLALVNVIDIAGILNGIFFFLFFFLATSIYFLPLIFVGYLARFDLFRTAANIIAVITGVYFLILSFARFSPCLLKR
jgi:sulfite exporter TauE/SafE